MKTEYRIDGKNFTTLEGFYDEFSQCVLGSTIWGHNLDAFNDVLRGGFGTPDGGFVLRWKRHDVSRERLGYPETVRQLEFRLKRCHPDNREAVGRDLANAQQGRGPTVFDWLIEIIHDHGAGGSEEVDGVELKLE